MAFNPSVINPFQSWTWVQNGQFCAHLGITPVSKNRPPRLSKWLHFNCFPDQSFPMIAMHNARYILYFEKQIRYNIRQKNCRLAPAPNQRPQHVLAHLIHGTALWEDTLHLVQFAPSNSISIPNDKKTTIHWICLHANPNLLAVLSHSLLSHLRAHKLVPPLAIKLRLSTMGCQKFDEHLKTLEALDMLVALWIKVSVHGVCKQ